MSRSLTTALKVTAAALTLAIAGAALPGVSTPAEAKKVVVKVGHGHHAHHHHHRHLRSFIVVRHAHGRYDGCYWLKKRAIETGRKYWWDRYYACKAD